MNTEQSLPFGLLWIIHIHPSIFIVGKTCVQIILSEPANCEEFCSFSSSGYICYYKDMTVKYFNRKWIIFLNSVLICGQLASPVFALLGNAKEE